MQLYLQPAVLLYPINNNTNFNAVEIILFNYKEVYIKCSACITHCISLQECMHISTDKLYCCILSSVERFFIVSRQALHSKFLKLSSSIWGSNSNSEALAAVMNTRSIPMLFIFYSLPSVFVYLCVFWLCLNLHIHCFVADYHALGVSSTE